MTKLDALQNMVTYHSILKDLAVRYNSDDTQKKLIDDHATDIVRQLGSEIPKGTSVKLVQDTNKVTHLVMPVNPSASELKDEALSEVAGGSVPIGCASSVGSFPSTLSSAGSVSSNDPAVGVGANDAIDLATGAAEAGYTQGVQDGYAYAQEQ